MNLEINQWYVRWFFWSCKVFDRLKPWRYYQGGRAAYYRRCGTNLCQFMRILFFGNLFVLVTICAFCYAFYVMVILPFQMFPVMWVIHPLLILSAIICAFACLIGVLFSVTEGVTRIVALFEQRKEQANKPSFVSLCIAYVRGIKSKVCPILQFKGSSPDDVLKVED